MCIASSIDTHAVASMFIARHRNPPGRKLNRTVKSYCADIADVAGDLAERAGTVGVVDIPQSRGAVGATVDQSVPNRAEGHHYSLRLRGR